ncbi:histidine phosphatase family protein [candidate division WWE3 bacterium]|uniref:Histidine phosphatase family protein n=1 Tax=candidate division WWE3 bacterium TaxID=2053526 RepID=A0A7X9E7D0_UNCKA|nr:histidine phosphatase family protein [candidate division WWE3 bacterium]
MSVNITYFVHGTTNDNLNDVSSGWSDAELSQKGVRQSIDLRKQIKDKKFDVVFCSDLKRAVKSAEITFKDRVPIIKEWLLRECNYGDYNGMPSRIVEPIQEKCITERFPNGESYEDVKLRMEIFLNELEKKYDGKNVAIVAHRAPQLALEVILKGKTWEEAFNQDWRKTKSWKPGWNYLLV